MRCYKVSIHIFGIRHHGPGCARSLRAALETLQPDIILVEGPPDAHNILPLMQDQAMQPPVALLIYDPTHPKRAVYYPFTHYSPEWQALSYAFQTRTPARFMDLPQAFQLDAIPVEDEQTAPAQQSSKAHHSNYGTSESSAPPSAEPEIHGENADEQQLREDPLALLAQAAGYDDHELWWERQIEQRQNVGDLFEGILEAMSALRDDPTPRDEREARREAYMRQTIRTAQKEGFERIAVVCGAWHAPVLKQPGSGKADSALLKGLKSIKIATTWIPWTNSRLSYRSGYGAGITSPGWYNHLWTTQDHLTIRWITSAARLLRSEGLDASSASVIEAVRLSETLAALRDLPQPGLAEHTEAIQTVLCNGDHTPMQLIQKKLEIGEKMGQVPSDAPTVPLLRDLEEQQRRLRLKPDTEQAILELDLRKETDRARSQLLHRLRLLSIPWGKPQRVRGKHGTFHEHWELQWQIDFIVSLIEDNIWGNTIEIAATTCIIEKGRQPQDLPTLTGYLDQAILAEIPPAINQLLLEIQKCAAISADVQHLMDALPPLARIARYSDVRQTRSEHILPIIDSLLERSIIGLPGACSSLDDDAARNMIKSINNVQSSIQLLEQVEQQDAWQHTLHSLITNENIHGLVRGRCCRILLEQQLLDGQEFQSFLQRALSPAEPVMQAAAWIEGVLQGNSLLILQQDNLWLALDQWLCQLTEETFINLLPIVRRTFANFQAPERQRMGEKVNHLYHTSHQTQQTGQDTLDHTRAELVLPLLAQIMGVTYDHQ
jgi:hypothetical protein